MMYLSWFLNLEGLDRKLKTLLFAFALEKGKPSHNSTLKIFKQEEKCFWWGIKQDKQTTSQVDTSWNFHNWNIYNAKWLHLD